VLRNTRVGTIDVAAAKSVATAADAVTRTFRSVDRDGDGVPDEPQALTAANGLGNAIASSFKPKQLGLHAAGGQKRELKCGPNEADTKAE
jgi:hypothetical protein